MTAVARTQLARSKSGTKSPSIRVNPANWASGAYVSVFGREWECYPRVNASVAASGLLARRQHLVARIRPRGRAHVPFAWHTVRVRVPLPRDLDRSLTFRFPHEVGEVTFQLASTTTRRFDLTVDEEAYTPRLARFPTSYLIAGLTMNVAEVSWSWRPRCRDVQCSRNCDYQLFAFHFRFDTRFISGCDTSVLEEPSVTNLW